MCQRSRNNSVYKSLYMRIRVRVSVTVYSAVYSIYHKFHIMKTLLRRLLWYAPKIIINWQYTVLPEKRDFIAEAIGNMTIEDVVTDVRNCTLHPPDLDRTSCRVKIVIQKLFLLWRLFPGEIICHFTPEAGGVVDRSRVHRAILFHACTMSSASNIFGWTKNTIADSFSRRIYIRHFRIQLQLIQ